MRNSRRELRSKMKNQNIFLHTFEDGMQWVDMEQKIDVAVFFLQTFFDEVDRR